MNPWRGAGDERRISASEAYETPMFKNPFDDSNAEPLEDRWTQDPDDLELPELRSNANRLRSPSMTELAFDTTERRDDANGHDSFVTIDLSDPNDRNITRDIEAQTTRPKPRPHKKVVRRVILGLCITVWVSVPIFTTVAAFGGFHAHVDKTNANAIG